MDYEPLPDDELDRVKLLEGILIGAATSGGGPVDNQTYIELRAALLQNLAIKALVPGPFDFPISHAERRRAVGTAACLHTRSLNAALRSLRGDEPSTN
jgi:hypothetical protein